MSFQASSRQRLHRNDSLHKSLGVEFGESVILCCNCSNFGRESGAEKIGLFRRRPMTSDGNTLLNHNVARVRQLWDDKSERKLRTTTRSARAGFRRLKIMAFRKFA